MTIAAARTTCVRVKITFVSHPVIRVLPAGVCVCVSRITAFNTIKIPDACAYHVETKPRVTKRIILNPTRRSPSFHARRVRVCGSIHARTDGWVDDLMVNCFYSNILWWRPKRSEKNSMKKMERRRRRTRQTRARERRVEVRGSERKRTSLSFFVCFEPWDDNKRRRRRRRRRRIHCQCRRRVDTPSGLSHRSDDDDGMWGVGRRALKSHSRRRRCRL